MELTKRDLQEFKEDLMLSVKTEISSVRDNVVLIQKDFSPLRKGMVSIQKDFAVLRNEFSSVKGGILRAMDDKFRILTDIMRSETRAIIKQEVRPIVREEVNLAVGKAKQEIVTEIADFMGESIAPQLDDHDKRITHLETQYVK